MNLLVTVFLTVLALVNGDLTSFLTCKDRSLSVLYEWSVLTYATPQGYVPDPSYRPNDTFITGVDVGDDNLFIATPRAISISPATLSTVPKDSEGNLSPILEPYPDITWHKVNGNATRCSRTLVSVLRTARDQCNRLWVLDSGVIYNLVNFQRICQPKIVIFDLSTGARVRTIYIPESALKPKSFLLNIVLDNPPTTDGDCDSQYVYIADTKEPALIVHKSPGNTFNRLSHPTMAPASNAMSFQVQNETLKDDSGIDGMDKGLVNFYYQPLASYNIYSVPIASLKQNALSMGGALLPVTVAVRKSSPGVALRLSSSDGCLLFNPASQSSIVGWNPITRLQRVLAQDPEIATIDDFQEDYSNTSIIYAANSRLQKYINRNVNPQEINLRIYKLTENQ